MARLGVAGIALALVLAPDIAMAAADSAVGAPPVPPMPVMRSAPPGPVAVIAPTTDRWSAVPGGWGAYRQPGYGQALPRHWVASAHFIADYRGAGLPTPAWGYGWSRYYDDVVLTDRWGRVYDWRSGSDLRDARRMKRRRDRSGVVGAIIGGAVGALTGNLIAGAGSRLAGSLIGGGTGALVGQAIDIETARGGDDRYGRGEPLRRPHWDMNYDMGYAERPEPAPCNCVEPVAAAQVCKEVKTVRYVTEYVRVPARAKAAPRGKYVPRAKYVPVT